MVPPTLSFKELEHAERRCESLRRIRKAFTGLLPAPVPGASGEGGESEGVCSRVALMALHDHMVEEMSEPRLQVVLRTRAERQEWRVVDDVFTCPELVTLEAARNVTVLNP